MIERDYSISYEISKYVQEPIVCACCGHKAKSGWLLSDGKVYAMNCAGDLVGCLPSTLRRLAKQILAEAE